MQIMDLVLIAFAIGCYVLGSILKDPSASTALFILAGNCSGLALAQISKLGNNGRGQAPAYLAAVPSPPQADLPTKPERPTIVK